MQQIILRLKNIFLYTFTFVDTVGMLLWAKCSSNFENDLEVD